MLHDLTVADNIKTLMKSKGLKQYALAEQANILPRDLSAMLNGRKQILSIHILPLAKALDTTPNVLYGLIEDQSSAQKTASLSRSGGIHIARQ